VSIVLARPVLLYDADCRFCRFVARAFVCLDRHERVAFLPLTDPEAKALLPGLTEEQRLASIHLVEPDAVRSSRGEALTRLIRHVGVPVPARLLSAVYTPIARARGVLGRLVPDGPAPRRYP
jgi:predicted DCC family thiol-disulfide oxidoreductase YuxK